VAKAAGNGVKVVSDDAGWLRSLLSGPGVTISATAADELLVTGLTAREVGTVAARNGVALFELTPTFTTYPEARFYP
jgi:ABC-2 type transport system ATP-binding protein